MDSELNMDASGMIRGYHDVRVLDAEVQNNNYDSQQSSSMVDPSPQGLTGRLGKDSTLQFITGIDMNSTGM